MKLHFTKDWLKGHIENDPDLPVEAGRIGEGCQIVLHPEDTNHQRLEKALRYAGMVNPNRHGLVDSAAHIFDEYDRLFPKEHVRSRGRKRLA